MTGKGSISRMLAQARPEDDQMEEPQVQAPAAPQPVAAELPPLELEVEAPAPPELRKPMTTRMKPSMLAIIDGLTQQIRDTGYKCTREYVLEALALELQDTRTDHTKPLRTRVAERIVRGEVR